MGPRVLFLDFGGTLVEPADDVFRAFGHVLGAMGFQISEEHWRRAESKVVPRTAGKMYQWIGRVPSYWDHVHREILRELGLPDREGRLQHALHQWFTSVEAHKPYPESERVLSDLRARGVPVHLVSNNTDWLLETLRNLGWTDRFASVTFSQEAGAEKPDRRIFDLALRRAGCSPASVIHAGDSWSADVVGARGAGVRPVWINRRAAIAPGACETMVDLSGLPPLFDEG